MNILVLIFGGRWNEFRKMGETNKTMKIEHQNKEIKADNKKHSSHLVIMDAAEIEGSLEYFLWQFYSFHRITEFSTQTNSTLNISHSATSGTRINSLGANFLLPKVLCFSNIHAESPHSRIFWGPIQIFFLISAYIRDDRAYFLLVSSSR